MGERALHTCAYCRRRDVPERMLQKHTGLWLGGALARVGEDETAFSQRDAADNVAINAVWTEEDADAERHIAWARGYFDAMQPHAGGRVYVNFLGEEGGNRVRQAYGARTYERLVKLKRAYTRPTSSGSTRTSSPERPMGLRSITLASAFWSTVSSPARGRG